MAAEVNQHTEQVQVETNSRIIRLLRWLRRLILARIWYIHSPPVVLMVQATPALCMQTLAAAAKPSTQRLHLRNLFIQGRRYHIQAQQGGFRLTTTRHVIWRYRKRTSSTAVMRGTLARFEENITRVELNVRMNFGYLLDIFLVPLFITSFLIFTPWNRAVILGCLAMLYGLSWIGHRYNAALEAHDMIWFVQKALDDLVPAQVMVLPTRADDTVYYNRDFGEAWQRFYKEHTNE